MSCPRVARFPFGTFFKIDSGSQVLIFLLRSLKPICVLAESSIIIKTSVPIIIFVMLATLDTWQGAKLMSFLISALPAEPIQVPCSSFIKRAIPGNPSLLYLSISLRYASLRGCRLLLSAQGIWDVPKPVGEIIAFLHDAASRLNVSMNNISFMAVNFSVYGLLELP